MMAHDSPWRFVYGCALAMIVALAAQLQFGT
jgi:hypothetical protein